MGRIAVGDCVVRHVFGDDTIGADGAMGSDYNLSHPLMYVGAVRGMDLPDAQKRAILGGNALELFGAALGERKGSGP